MPQTEQFDRAREAMSFVVRKLGTAVSQPEVTRILRALGFGVTESVPGILTVTVRLGAPRKIFR